MIFAYFTFLAKDFRLSGYASSATGSSPSTSRCESGTASRMERPASVQAYNRRPSREEDRLQRGSPAPCALWRPRAGGCCPSPAAVPPKPKLPHPPLPPTSPSICHCHGHCSAKRARPARARPRRRPPRHPPLRPRRRLLSSTT